MTNAHACATVWLHSQTWVTLRSLHTWHINSIRSFTESNPISLQVLRLSWQWLGWTARAQCLSGERYCSLLHSVQTGSGVHHVLCTTDSVGYFPRGVMLTSQEWHSVPPSPHTSSCCRKLPSLLHMLSQMPATMKLCAVISCKKDNQTSWIQQNISANHGPL
jgi:hypothetical protein